LLDGAKPGEAPGDGAGPADAAVLDRITRIATRSLGVSGGLVSLVGGDREYFKRHTGLTEPWATYGETPLSHSLSRHVVETEKPLFVDDARSHPLIQAAFAEHDASVVAFGGVPLILTRGDTVGVLSVIDSAPRAWSVSDSHLLEDLAGVVTDALERRRALAGGVLRDGLTGLPGHGLFRVLVERAISNRGSRRAAVVAVGLERLRLVNEAHGHEVGDRLLVAAGRRLASLSSTYGAVCRLAGVDFLMLCDLADDDPDGTGSALIARECVAGASFEVDGEQIPIGASVGVVVIDPAAEVDQVIDAALEAMRQKAVSGRVDPDRRTRASARLLIQGSIANAHERGELHLAYQPVVAVGTRRPVGFEALLRWDHPELGPIRPDDFIPVAEASGAIVDIGRWVIARATADLAGWRAQHAHEQLWVSVNAGPGELTAGLLASMRHALASAGLPGDAVMLEITERALLVNGEAVLQTLDDLRAMGVTIALDDFGVGYSSLSYLTRFPIDVLKIDKSFVAQIETDERGATLVAGIGALSRVLDVTPIGEGIETDGQARAIEGAGYELGQGYLFSHPVAAEAVPDLLAG
jgi:diguanylate cyclase (GGDEF)-like protein